MKVFLDASVIVSVLNHEMPTFTYSARLMSLPQYQTQYQLFTSPICLAIAYYFAEKKCGSKKAIEKMQILSSQIKVTSIGQEEVFLMYGNKKINDYEDGLQYYSAKQSGCQIIITENVKDFYFSEIPVHTSKDFILNVL
jgi:predicted nucleic acid-binding protein